MREEIVGFYLANRSITELVELGGDTRLVGAAFGRALGWRWPEGMDPLQAGWVARLCQRLNVNLIGRPPETR
jgi:hypothetical protein